MSDAVRNWLENDELFAEQLEVGHRFARRVAARLRSHGLQVKVTPKRWRRTLADRHAFADEHDLTVGARRPCRIDVKSRGLSFRDGDPATFPYPRAFVETERGWKRKRRRPLAIVLVSQPTDGVLVVPVSTAPTWKAVERYDEARGITDRFLTIRRDQLRTLTELAWWLQEREQ